jgi:hypothetical protein
MALKIEMPRINNRMAAPFLVSHKPPLASKPLVPQAYAGGAVSVQIFIVGLIRFGGRVYYVDRVAICVVLS